MCTMNFDICRRCPTLMDVVKNYVKAKKINANFKSNFDLRVNLNLKTPYFLH